MRRASARRVVAMAPAELSPIRCGAVRALRIVWVDRRLSSFMNAPWASPTAGPPPWRVGGGAYAGVASGVGCDGPPSRCMMLSSAMLMVLGV